MFKRFFNNKSDIFQAVNVKVKTSSQGKVNFTVYGYFNSVKLPNLTQKVVLYKAQNTTIIRYYDVLKDLSDTFSNVKTSWDEE